jgi:hypothetical protein
MVVKIVGALRTYRGVNFWVNVQMKRRIMSAITNWVQRGVVAKNWAKKLSEAVVLLTEVSFR